ncbi:hypothetical protein DDB_G0282547 [Dictyostelium discoideum AX4]|uniref:Uncharacterized protein n=1 Tax=Dictyostelium discoideum TaxID=44689 RepID=Q54SC1_DICDI|nr:hypothetical protein DDB_G0282547 [Dictyostelium discoideum AX4]EAL66133.1 hypothetical protein DDB_G0282547 [Dictyostelium discoideum AX4]|eukprot:XP_640118.1 hypothetical protein DDB_G0282547 [Dictyostelium discoideum AX4]
MNGENQNQNNIKNDIIKEINLENIEKLGFHELYHIAQSCRIFSPALKKSEIISQIRQQYYMEMGKKEISNIDNSGKLLNQEIKNSLNNNHKNLPLIGSNNLMVKDNIENFELLFWRVIKNKYLFRWILSFLDTLSNTFSPLLNRDSNLLFKKTKNYYEAIEINWMIKNNHKQLLIDKVVCIIINFFFDTF